MTTTHTKLTKQNKPAPKPVSKAARTRTKSPGKSRRPIAPPAIAAPVPAAKVTKRDQLATLLVRDEGATLDQMIAATGWLPHTTRAALTGLKKRGYAIDSDKIDGVRTYRAVAPK